MDFSSALPTFVITLREGVEAALVVGIVLACLKKAKQSYLSWWVYAAVAVGIAASGIVGVLLSQAAQALSQSQNPYAATLELFLEAIFGLVAIVMLSWMLIWMTKQARFMKTQVEGAIEQAMATNAGWGVFTLVFVAVLREGFETVLFIVAKFQQGLIPSLGSLAGLSVAAAIGALLFKWGIKINIRRFFQVMGVLLLLIVSGLVVSSLGHFDTAIATLAQSDRQSAGMCVFYEKFTKVHSCNLGGLVWNATKVLPEDKFPGLLLSALFGYTDKLYLVPAIAYIGFLISIGGIYFRSLNPPSSKRAHIAAPAKTN
ncbi:FTR1 family iron permease [Chamaesiphon minutus]|uniref:High-affinity Fe2+/Pb2+ permease n=1 Tax=Chamaesiphon minutus (strain ATCC 27169 / PCC 6605) TaxID=1173020 RepID=K9UH90_CHAP6|nr:FTR1 family protein [Chamaesiphon minutus]AFY94013.1 high-affinity Fe2+/Pb2+ permease [Chamaesiphon minutus PCC 6605]